MKGALPMKLVLSISNGVTLDIPLLRIKETKKLDFVEIAGEQYSNRIYEFFILFHKVSPNGIFPTHNEFSHPDLSWRSIDLKYGHEDHQSNYQLVRFSSYNKIAIDAAIDGYREIGRSHPEIKVIKKDITELTINHFNNAYDDLAEVIYSAHYREEN